MVLYVGNASIETASSSFSIKDSSLSTIFERGISQYSGNNFSYYLNNNVPGFIAGATTDPSWVNIGASGWVKLNNYTTTTSYNKGNNYSTVNTRFTAPQNGPYLFIFSSYMYTAAYFHPQFYVNGSPSSRRNSTPYRIRAHGFVANYAIDCQMEEVINLVAGDYVEVFAALGGQTYSYVYYSLFQGVFAG